MSANVESMVSAHGITPWHREGTVVEGDLTALQAWQLSGQDFLVEKLQLHTPEGIAIPNVYATRRTDTGEILTRCKVVSEKWKPLQNADGWKILDPLFESGQIEPETAGVLDGGRKVWILASFKGHESVDVGDGDIVKQYVLFANGHDGSLSITIGTTQIRVVCQNTLSYAQSADDNTLLRVRHMSGAMVQLENAADILANMGAQFEANADVYRALTKIKITSGKTLAEYVAAVYGVEEQKAQDDNKVSRRLRSVVENFESGMGSDLVSAKGTAWGLYNALTEYVSHSGGDESKRLDSLAFGGRAGILRRGLEAAVVLGKGIPLSDVFDSDTSVMHKTQEATWAP